MEFFNIFAGVASILSLLISLFVAVTVVKINNNIVFNVKKITKNKTRSKG
ncbi:hypothetical protein J2S11_000373 [Bacillus horti]|uniref:Uncharacterized protein n=1 Tax=Caldalkalibacillus horti TaxID=77523 RepID=A0ABT9VU22_9BACI|nr:hypothetical protein [Bacillus horti]